MTCQISLHELYPGRNGGPMPLLEIVEHDHIVAARNQLRDAVAADEAGAAGDQNGSLMRHIKLLIDTARKNPETLTGTRLRSRSDIGVS
jgi:hypothetical protein